MSAKTIGLIAGSGELPLIFAREARRLGAGQIVTVAFHGETSEAIVELSDETVWLRVGQLSKMIRAFSDRDVRHCVMAGQIAPDNLFRLRPDLKTVGMLLRLSERNAHTLFGAIAEELKKGGIELIEATPWLQAAMPGTGFHLGPKLNDRQREDIAFGQRIAKATSGLEIGQTVVVKQGTVLAVEGFEGTDACLARGGELAGPKGSAVAVKVAKDNHDMRFDIPCIGRKTLEVCATHRIAVLAVEPERTILLEREDVETLARKRGVSLVTFNPD